MSEKVPTLDERVQKAEGFIEACKGVLYFLAFVAGGIVVVYIGVKSIDFVSRVNDIEYRVEKLEKRGCACKQKCECEVKKCCGK